jgi:5-methylcytosine-specific restriction enzyme subunit McrC
VKKSLLVEEWDEIRFGATHGDITREEAEALDRVAAGAGAKELFHWSRSGVSPRNWIGVVKSAGIQLSIVPKGWKTLDKAKQVQFEQNLLHLAARGQGLRLHEMPRADIQPHPSPSAFLFSSFLAQARLALRRRAVREYRVHQEIGPRLRGAMVFPAQLIVNLARPGSFVTRATELTWDNPFNRVLATACDVIARSGYKDLRVRAMRTALAVRAQPVVERIDEQLARARRMRLGRTHAACIDLAELVIKMKGGRGLFVGTVSLGAELVASDRIWELGVTSVIMSEAPGRFIPQPSHHYALARSTAQGVVKVAELKPDLLATKTASIIDLKWKIIDVVKPKLDSDDMYQVLGYAQYFGCSRVVLLYPAVHGNQATVQHVTTSDPHVTVDMAFLPVTEDWAEFRASVGRLISDM